MSAYDYLASFEISKTDPPFYALIMAAMRRADTINLALLRSAFPATYTELEARYNSPGGLLPGDRDTGETCRCGQPAHQSAYGQSCDQWPLCKAAR